MIGQSAILHEGSESRSRLYWYENNGLVRLCLTHFTRHNRLGASAEEFGSLLSKSCRLTTSNDGWSTVGAAVDGYLPIGF